MSSFCEKYPHLSECNHSILNTVLSMDYTLIFSLFLSLIIIELLRYLFLPTIYTYGVRTSEELKVGISIKLLEDVIIPPFGTIRVQTALACKFPNGYVGLVHENSNVLNKGCCVNSGLIHPGSEHQLQIMINNPSSFETSFNKNEEIAKLLLLQLPSSSQFKIVDTIKDLTDSIMFKTLSFLKFK